MASSEEMHSVPTEADKESNHDVVLIRRSNSTRLARIIAKPIHYVNVKTNAVSKATTRPLGTLAKDNEGANANVFAATECYKVQFLNDDLTPTDQGKIITKSDIVASMTPHFRGMKLLELKHSLPADIRVMMDEAEIDAMSDANERTNVMRLKLFMNRYKSNHALLEKIKLKLNSIMLSNYESFHSFHGGAHPEWVMNAFIYNPNERETRFKVMRMDGNQVTYQPYVYNAPQGGPITIGLDAFLKLGINQQNRYGMWKSTPIGEVYRILPERDEEDIDEMYDNAKVNNYLEQLMVVFAHKPSSILSSVPQSKEGVKLSNFAAKGGRKRTHHKRHNKNKKRTYQRRK